MPTDNFRVQMTRGTTDQNDAYVGQPGELTLDLDKNEFRVHDGVNVGGKKFGGRPGNVLDNFRDTFTGDVNGTYIYRQINGSGLSDFTFDPSIVDGDICFVDATAAVLYPTYGSDSSVTTVTVTTDPNYEPESLVQYVADVTNHKVYLLNGTQEFVPQHLQDIMVAPVGDAEGILWVSVDNPGKLTTVDPLVSHGINSKQWVMRTLTHGFIPSNGLTRRGSIEFEAQEGEDISLRLRVLCSIYKQVVCSVPAGVTCESTRIQVRVGEGTFLYVIINGRVDVRVRIGMSQYLTSGPWFICSGFSVYDGGIELGGAGEIHHHVPPNTKLFPAASQLIEVGSYPKGNTMVKLVSHNLDIYQTIGVVGIARGGSNSFIYLAGVNFHEERRSPSVGGTWGPGAPIVNSGSWSFGSFNCVIRTSTLTITGAYTTIPTSIANSGQEGSEFATNYAGTMIL